MFRWLLGFFIVVSPKGHLTFSPTLKVSMPTNVFLFNFHLSFWEVFRFGQVFKIVQRFF